MTYLDVDVDVLTFHNFGLEASIEPPTLRLSIPPLGEEASIALGGFNDEVSYLKKWELSASNQSISKCWQREARMWSLIGKVATLDIGSPLGGLGWPPQTSKGAVSITDALVYLVKCPASTNAVKTKAITTNGLTDGATRRTHSEPTFANNHFRVRPSAAVSRLIMDADCNCFRYTIQNCKNKLY